jgi:hypothetical protein
MRITVTTKDIEEGRRRDPSECPVARALRRAGISHFGVTGMLVIVQTGRNHVPLVLPANVQDWILDFDWGSAMAPIDFELMLPHEQERQQERVGAGQHATEPAGAKRVTEVRASSAAGRAPKGLPGLPRWGASAKGLLGRSLRRCQPRRKSRGQATIEEARELLSS